jgi:hypothetical protein
MTDRLPDEPKGWRKLQAKALKERDPQKLDDLLTKINDLLTKHEKQKELKGLVKIR